MSNLFKKKFRKTKHAYNEFLRDICLSILSQEKKVYVEKITEQEVFLATKSFSNNKSPENDGLAKEFYETILGRTKFVKPSKNEQKIGHIPKTTSNKISRKEGLR